MKFIIPEKTPSAEPVILITMEIDDDGDPTVLINGIKVMYISHNTGIVRRYSHDLENILKLKNVGICIAEHNRIAVE